MIIEGLMNLVYKLISIVLTPINISSFPEGTDEAVTDFLDLLFNNSQTIIGLFIPSIAFTLLLIVMGIEIAIHGYRFIMWVLRKIPMLGIN